MFDQISASIQRAQDSVNRRVNSLRNREGSTASTRGVDLAISSSRGASPEALTRAAVPASGAGQDSVPAYSYDVAIRFIGASGLPGLDINGQSDPYVVANLDDRIEFKSSVRPTTLTPIWNEQWFVKNVPSTATLHVRVFDKDDNARDDFIGSFKCPIREGAQECRLDSNDGAQRGTLWFEVKLTPSVVPGSAQYCFDGPVSFSRHISAALGRFAGTKGSGLEGKATYFASALPAVVGQAESSPLPTPSASKPVSSAERMRRHVYSTWKIHLKGVSLFFGDEQQHWLESYAAAQKIFTGPVLLRTSIRTAHRLLYARTSLNEFGIITDADTLWKELAPQDRSALSEAARPSSPDSSPRLGGTGRKSWLVKPALYTYIIGMDDRLRFSETGAAFFTDFASKHALHACVNDYVRYAGEFHPRPCVEGGWAGLEGMLPPEDCEWALWIDNASGTYGPDPELLPKLKETLEYNFPGLKVEAFDYKNEELVKSKADMFAYARSKPAMVSSPSQLADGVQQLDLSTGSEPSSVASNGTTPLPTERDLITG